MPISEQTKLSSAEGCKTLSLRGSPEPGQQAVRLSLWERANVIHQVPAICFGKSFAECRHRLFPGCNLPEERSVRFRCELWIGKFRRVNVELDHGRAVRVPGFPVTHRAGFRIVFWPAASADSRRGNGILFLRLCRRSVIHVSDLDCASLSTTSAEAIQIVKGQPSSSENATGES